MTARNSWSLRNYAVDQTACWCGAGPGETCVRPDGTRHRDYTHADRIHDARPMWIVERPR